MRAGITLEDEERKLKKFENEAEETRKRIEKNKVEYELQQNLTKKLQIENE